jgi:hypothetical protein
MTTRKKLHPKRIKRLQWLDDAIRNSEGQSFDELLNLMNSRMRAECDRSQYSKLSISQRSLHEDLRMLKDGALDGKRRQLVFDKQLQTYHYGFTKSNWTDSDLSDEQLATLPFLFSILEPFKGISAIDMVLEDVAMNHNLMLKEFQSDWTVVSHQMPNKTIQNRLNKMVSEIMSHINKGQGIHFDYSYVRFGANREKMASTRTVYPLQLRMWSGRYFLVSVPVDNKNLIKTYALDGIKHGRITTAFNDKNKPLQFNHIAIAKKLKLKTYFNHSIGVFREQSEQEQPTEILQWFIAYAAASVMAVPLHQSQKLLETRGNAALFSFRVYPTQEWESAISKYGDLTWNNSAGIKPEKHRVYCEF